MESASSPTKDVLYNPDLLGIICRFIRPLSVSMFLPSIGTSGTKSLCALALTCHATCDTALDYHWQDISGMKPLLSIFPRAISPSSNLPWVRRDPASHLIMLTVHRYPPMPYQAKHGPDSTDTRTVSALLLLMHTRVHCTPQLSSYALLRKKNPFFPN